MVKVVENGTGDQPRRFAVREMTNILEDNAAIG